jgi:hypothetical protein
MKTVNHSRTKLGDSDMGNWMHGFFQYSNNNSGDTSKQSEAAFRAGVAWGRKDMLQHAVTTIQDMHDEHAEDYGQGLTNESLSGYQIAEKLVNDWKALDV